MSDMIQVAEIAAANAPRTVASHASMFTGLLPATHKCDNQYRYLPVKLDTVAELRQAGFKVRTDSELG